MSKIFRCTVGLYNSHFIHGSLLISYPVNLVLMEDIVFNPVRMDRHNPYYKPWNSDRKDRY